MTNFIQGAIRHPGALHKDLGVPQGHMIPVERIKSVAKGNSKTAQRARLALRLRAMHNPKMMEKKPSMPY